MTNPEFSDDFEPQEPTEVPTVEPSEPAEITPSDWTQRINATSNPDELNAVLSEQRQHLQSQQAGPERLAPADLREAINNASTEAELNELLSSQGLSKGVVRR